MGGNHRLLADILDAGQDFDQHIRRPGAHREVLGEVYARATEVTRQQCEGGTPVQIRCRLVGEYRRASGRERYQARHHTPVRDGSILNSGVPVGSLGHSPPRDPLDELIHQDTYRRLAAAVAELPDSDRLLLRTLTGDLPDGLTMAAVAKQIGVSLRTMERHRTRVLRILRKRLEGSL